MFEILPKWFWKIMVVLWSLALLLVIYQSLFETAVVKHLWLSSLYIGAILFSVKQLGWFSRGENLKKKKND